MPLYYKSKKFKTLITVAVLAAFASVFLISSFLKHYQSISLIKQGLDSKSQLVELKSTILKLRLALNNTANIIEENQRLREMIKLHEREEDIFLSSQVIARSPFDWEKRVKIDRGLNDGLAKGDLVLDHNGFLLGKVESIDKSSAWVILISDPDFRISVICNDERYLLKGDSKRNGRLLYVPYDDKLTVGDKIVLRESSLSFPNIPVAEVLNVNLDRNFLTADVKVTFAADPQDVSLVFVVSTSR